MIISDLLHQYTTDLDNPILIQNIAYEYERLGQTASAISFYLRAAEKTTDKVLSYKCLIKLAQCFERQGNRLHTVKTCYHNAISLLPTRPEAYYFLSKVLEHEKNHFEAYTYACIGLFNIKENDIDVGYPGTYGLIFQKAINGWWRGNCNETRLLLRQLVDQYWDQLDCNHKQAVENNIRSLGAGTADKINKKYDKGLHSKLRYKFNKSETIEHNYSQAYQDMFVLLMTKGKSNGTFLEIGGADPYYANNTCLLEKQFGWKGVSIEYDEKFIACYKKERPNTTVYNIDALVLDYKAIIDKNFDTKNIDYLQVDIDPISSTYDCLLKLPFDEYKFGVITFEHDYYVDVTRSYRQKSRDYLSSKGYILVAGNISPCDNNPFEDWWVHPDLVENQLIELMKRNSDEPIDSDKYFLL